jgi:hypothetical protein
MSMLVILEVINTYTYKIYKTWYRHGVIAKGVSGFDPALSIAIITIWRLETFIPATFKWLTVIATQQFQFLIPSLIIRIIVSNIMDYKSMIKNKCDHEQ